MASIISTVLTDIANVVVTLTVDKAELGAGALVKVGEIGSIGGNPVYMYLSENPAAT
jgi:hypothetical protein